MKGLFRLVGFLFLVFFISCQTDPDSQRQATERPHDPWVFRSVLDEKARMLTIALDKDVWLSYHTPSGSLYKAWKGVVNFEGAVYDHAHGPQPNSVGDAYIEGKERAQWQLIKDGNEIPSRIDYRGHKFVDGEVQLLLSLENSNTGVRSNISVMPKISYDKDAGRKYLEWVLQVDELEDGHQIRYRTDISSLVVDQQFIRPNDFVVEQTTEYNFDNTI